MKVERVDNTTTVKLTVYTEKKGVALDPHHIVSLLKSSDVNRLSILLGYVVDADNLAYGNDTLH